MVLDFHKNWCGRCANGGCPSVVCCNFLITTWQMCKLLKLGWH